MNPVDPPRAVLILDAVAGLRVVLHNLAGAAGAANVQLKEDDIFLGGHPQLVVPDQVLNYDRVQDGQQEGYEVRVPVLADAPEHDIRRNEPGGHREGL